MVPVAYARMEALGSMAAKGKDGVDPRLAPAAHQFEAILIQELLKPMEHDPLFASGSSDGMGLMSGDAQMSTWSSLGAQSLAKAIADAGGLGIAKEMMQEVEAQAEATPSIDPGAQQAHGTKPAVGAGVEGLQSGSEKGISLRGGTDLHSWATVRRLP